jgi:hypothetical protein
MDYEFDKERIVNYWIESSDKDFKAMLDLYNTQNNKLGFIYGTFSD